MTSETITRAILAHPSGGTVTTDGRTLTVPDDYPARYVVGGVVPSITLDLDVDRSAIVDSVDALLPSAVGLGAGIGWWLADETLWLDVVTFHADLAETQGLLAERGEIAAWDAYEGHEVYARAGAQ